MKLFSAVVWFVFSSRGIMNNLNKTWWGFVSEDDVRDGNVLLPNWEEFVKYTSSPYSSSVVLPPFKPVLLSFGSYIDNFRPPIPSCCSPMVLCEEELFWLSYFFFFLMSVLLLWSLTLSNKSCLGPKNQTTKELFPLAYVRVVLPWVSVIDYQESMCLGGV